MPVAALVSKSHSVPPSQKRVVDANAAVGVPQSWRKLSRELQ